MTTEEEFLNTSSKSIFGRYLSGVEFVGYVIGWLMSEMQNYEVAVGVDGVIFKMIGLGWNFFRVRSLKNKKSLTFEVKKLFWILPRFSLRRSNKVNIFLMHYAEIFTIYWDEMQHIFTQITQILVVDFHKNSNFSITEIKGAEMRSRNLHNLCSLQRSYMDWKHWICSDIL